MVDLLITHGDLFTMRGEGSGYLADGAVAVDGSRIVAVGPTSEVEKEYTARRTVDATGKAVLPGLIDGHVHSCAALTRGLAQDAPTWHEGVDPYFQHATPDALLAGAQLAAIEAIRAGTTTLADYGPGITLVAPFYRKLGIRAALSVLISELPPTDSDFDPRELYPFEPGLGEAAYRENLELVEKWEGAADGRITTMFGPQGPEYCSRELLIRIRQSAEKYDLKIHHHVGQSEPEILQLQKRYGQRPVEFLKSIGYLGERLHAAHMSRLTDEEVREVARSGASMAFCPSSQVLCDGIVSPADVFSKAGGQVCLGTDETCTNNGTNLFIDMKLAALLLKMKNQDLTEMPCWKVLRMATIEGACAIGLGHEVGSLEPGKKADVILIDLGRPSMMPVLRKPVRNIVPNLVLSARGDEVVLSIIDGRVVFESGRIRTVDETELLALAQGAAEEVSEAAGPSLEQRPTVQFRLTEAGKY